MSAPGNTSLPPRRGTGRLTGWLPLAVLGGCCLLLGAVLTASPFRSLTVLVWLVAAGAIVTGLGELARDRAGHRRPASAAVGGLFVVAGVVAALYPGLTVGALAILIGLALLVGGLIRTVSGIRPSAPGRGGSEPRLLSMAAGVTNMLAGALAVSWPAVTVLVLAIVFGVRTMLFGFTLIARARNLRRGVSGRSPRLRPRWVRAVGAAAALAVALAAAGISVAVHRAAPPATGAFYAPVTPLPAQPPGTVLRTEVIDGFHSGATAYRVLYLSTGFDGKPAAVSGLVVIPDAEPANGGRKIVAFTHGTVGVASNCSPSAQGAAATALMEGLDQFLAAGYVVAATDYQGLGTAGPHPYLVGTAEGRNELDIVRAARNIAETKAGKDFAVWGHSQGGHAAIFTAQLAASYAPELHLVGVAAGAPVPNLIDLFKVNIDTTIGKVLISMALQSWSEVYSDARLSQIVTPAARPLVRKVATYCFYGESQILATVPATILLGYTFLSNPPWDTEPWKTIVDTNTPTGNGIDAPILITQGAADPIVAPGVSQAFAEKLCAAGMTVEFKLYPGVAHVDAGFRAATDVAAWIADRFAGRAAGSTCA